jgi:hypothetical protein
MLVSFQIAAQAFVLSDERRIGAPSAPRCSRRAARRSCRHVRRRGQTVGDGSMLVFVDDPKTGRLIWRGVITAQTRVRSRGRRTARR